MNFVYNAHYKYFLIGQLTVDLLILLRVEESRKQMKSAWVNPPSLAALLLVFACSAREQTPPRNAAADLGGTSWQLVKFQGGDDKTLTPDDKAKYTIQFSADGGLTARIDCNRGRGAWKSSGASQLQLGPLALTRAQCAPGSLHDQLVKHWEFVRSYIIKDGHLFLSLMADGGIYEFEPLSASKPASPNSPVTIKGPV